MEHDQSQKAKEDRKQLFHGLRILLLLRFSLHSHCTEVAEQGISVRKPLLPSERKVLIQTGRLEAGDFRKPLLYPSELRGRFRDGSRLQFTATEPAETACHPRRSCPLARCYHDSHCGYQPASRRGFAEKHGPSRKCNRFHIPNKAASEIRRLQSLPTANRVPYSQMP